MQIAYLCNGKNPRCGKNSFYCTYNGMPRPPKYDGVHCRHTLAPAYALNGAVDNPAEHPDRFVEVSPGKWWEK